MIHQIRWLILTESNLTVQRLYPQVRIPPCVTCAPPSSHDFFPSHKRRACRNHRARRWCRLPPSARTDATAGSHYPFPAPRSTTQGIAIAPSDGDPPRRRIVRHQTLPIASCPAASPSAQPPAAVPVLLRPSPPDPCLRLVSSASPPSSCTAGATTPLSLFRRVRRAQGARRNVPSVSSPSMHHEGAYLPTVVVSSNYYA